MSIVNKKNNVSGNWSQKLGKQYTMAMGKTKEFITKKKIKHGAQFKTYAGPTVKAAKGITGAAVGLGKFAIRKGALGYPGLIATGAYYGAKHAIKKGERVYKRTPYKQFDKKGRWMI